MMNTEAVMNAYMELERERSECCSLAEGYAEDISDLLKTIDNLRCERDNAIHHLETIKTLELTAYKIMKARAAYWKWKFYAGSNPHNAIAPTVYIFGARTSYTVGSEFSIWERRFNVCMRRANKYAWSVPEAER